jgi:CRISPR system Cascade subunit CasD
MKHVLLLRLVGPMQSWGVQSQFTERDTGLEPSKSGVVGLLCAALGRERNEPIDDLTRLKMGVRVDRQGILRYDDHTAQNVREASAKTVDLEKKTGIRGSVSKRYYLSDAAFLVGLEDESLDLLKSLQAGLQTPRWALYLGRKAFVPATPVHLKDGLRENQDLYTALTYPWLGRKSDERPKQLRVVIEEETGDQVRPDQPISFALFDRRFAPRRVEVSWVDTPTRILEEE